jgi:hypothetical protein
VSEGNPLDNQIKSVFRYLIFSSSRGVYLGGGVWSKDSTAFTKSFAPTYEPTITNLVDSGVWDADFRTVFPDLAGNHCSKDAVVKAGLEAW